MSLLQKLYDLVLKGISVGEPLRMGLVETLVDAFLRSLDKRRLGSLFSLADWLEGIKGERKTKDIIVSAAYEPSVYKSCHQKVA